MEMLKAMVGLEAEVLIRDKDGNLVIPPSWWDRDDYPLLAEIRGEPGNTVATTIARFEEARLNLKRLLEDGQVMDFADFCPVPLCTYREVNRELRNSGRKKFSNIQNIYGTEIETFTDQIIKNGRIQGINVSCGLHLHFSLVSSVSIVTKQPVYQPVVLPISVSSAKAQLGTTEMILYRKLDGEVEETIEATVSKLNAPAIRYMVSCLDDAFFERFAPPKSRRTKYRQPGYYELKPYGFEYRSLPATLSMSQLEVVVEFCFRLLGEVGR